MKKISQTIKQKFDDPGKEKTLKWHFTKRMKQRLDITLTDSDYDHIVACIKNNKESDFFVLTYLRNQSNRLMVYEIKYPDTLPVNIIYDNQRKAIVTVLFQEEHTEINYYYDVFNNKISVKHDLGYNCLWAIKDDKLCIPSETIETSDDGTWEVVSEGTLLGKRFKLDVDTLIEIM